MGWIDNEFKLRMKITDYVKIYENNSLYLKYMIDNDF